MNEKFWALPKEKRLRIINSCMEVFARNDYKHASTDEMAAKAGISKGLLFYYFHNKKALYLFLFQYAEDYMKKQVVTADFEEITDFFDLMLYAADSKAAILKDIPYMTDFVMAAFYSQKEEVSEALDARMSIFNEESLGQYFKNVDFTKFRDTVSPKEIMDMLTWLADGYLHTMRRMGANLDMSELQRVFRRWCEMLREISYKEEYLHGSNLC